MTILSIAKTTKREQEIAEVIFEMVTAVNQLT